MATTYISDTEILSLFQRGRTTMGPIPIGTPKEEEDLLKDVRESIDKAEENNGNDDTDEEES